MLVPFCCSVGTTSVWNMESRTTYYKFIGINILAFDHLHIIQTTAEPSQQLWSYGWITGYSTTLREIFSPFFSLTPQTVCDKSESCYLLILERFVCICGFFHPDIVINGNNCCRTAVGLLPISLRINMLMGFLF